MKAQGTFLAIALLLAPPAFADGDSSSDARNGFISTLQQSEGLMVKVPVNQAGEELVSEAETRIYTGEAIVSESDFAKAFDRSTAVDSTEIVTEDQVANDSSTAGWYYGPRHYSHYRYYGTPGYWSRGYYTGYYPSYYYYGSYYPYSSPYWRTYYGPGYGYYPYYGYRYYYYGRYW